MPKILAIDDKLDNLISIKALLNNTITGCEIITAQSGKEGIEKAIKELPDTILLDIYMPKMDGYEVCEKLKANSGTKHIPVIMITAVRTDSKSRVKGLETGADAYISKPIVANELASQVKVMLRIKKAEDKLRSEKDILEEMVQKRTEKLRKTQEGTILTIARIIGIKDPYTSGHQERVSQLATAIAEEMNLSKEKVEGIKISSLVHDIGKIDIPTEILSRPGKITDIEFSLIQKHATTGYKILKEIDYTWPIAEIVYQHHENLDGTGYPQGLKDGDILIEAQIVRVADVIEAMSSHRPYRPALGIEKALEEISKNKGILYNIEVVDTCLKLFQDKKFKFQMIKTTFL
ncbi:MAG: response regulator [Candidatus Caldatribacteriota bacterium]|nr:response regulator [Candidatus Caldatribacteriota bacterium]